MGNDKDSTGQTTQPREEHALAVTDSGVSGRTIAASNKLHVDGSNVGAVALGPNSRSEGTVYRQDGNTVQGDQAGRDLFKPTYIMTGAQRFCYMQNLIDKYKKEVDQNQSFKAIIETLQHYIARMDRGAVAGLHTKLTLADWDDDEIREATRLKELFHKQLRRHLFSEYAQHILAHLLGLVYINFKSHILPLIAEGAPRDIIEATVAAKVIRPAIEELDENVLNLHIAEIQGALFFLTGNCHVKWH